MLLNSKKVKIEGLGTFYCTLENQKKGALKKEETWKTVIQVIVSILTAALTALGTTSCMGHGPIIL